MASCCLRGPHRFVLLKYWLRQVFCHGKGMRYIAPAMPGSELMLTLFALNCWCPSRSSLYGTCSRRLCEEWGINFSFTWAHFKYVMTHGWTPCATRLFWPCFDAIADSSG